MSPAFTKFLYLVLTSCSQHLAGTSDTGDISKPDVNGYGRGHTHNMNISSKQDIDTSCEEQTPK